MMSATTQEGKARYYFYISRHFLLKTHNFKSLPVTAFKRLKLLAVYVHIGDLKHIFDKLVTTLFLQLLPNTKCFSHTDCRRMFLRGIVHLCTAQNTVISFG